MNQAKKIKLLLLILSLNFTISAQNYMLMWDPNPANENISSYFVYQGQPMMGKIGETTNTFFYLTLTNGSYVFGCSAFNGMESEISTISFTTGEIVNPPQNLAVFKDLEIIEAESVASGKWGITNNFICYTVFSGTQITNPVTELSYSFDIRIAGEYAVLALASALDRGSDSIFIDIDSPVSTNKVWGIKVFSDSFQPNFVSFGNGVAVWNLNPGEHFLNIGGREQDLRIDKFIILQKIASP